MRITILTVGSQGDVQPFLALGTGLQAAGHRVRIATNELFRDAIRGRGLDFSGLPWNPGRMLGKVLDANPLLLLRETVRNYGALLPQIYEQALRSCEDADLVLVHPGVLFIADVLADRLRRPVCQAHYDPFTPTRFRPNFLFPPLPHGLQFSLGGFYNEWTHWVFAQGGWLAYRGAINRARRKTFGLPPLSARLPRRFLRPSVPFLYCFSPHVVPPAPDWDRNIHVTGFWFLDRDPDWQPPERLRDFLAAGPPPVFVGFGSMMDREPEALARLVLEALARSGQRGILAKGWGGLGAVAESDRVLFLTEAVPHDWLFPRTAAVVHHGGAGTTAAGLRAGTPTVVVPYFGDQPFWGRRVRDLGVGAGPVPRKQLTAERLAETLRAANDPLVRSRAAELGARIRAENGIARAVEVLERIAAAAPGANRR